MKEKILLVTGGGDCPGLNASIRAVCLRAGQESWDVWGSINAFNGILNDPPDIIQLQTKDIRGIHSLGGTILGTSNTGVPSRFPMKNSDGSLYFKDRSNELIEKIRAHGFTAVINIGGDGSQRISYELSQKGLPIIGIPKTIDNDLACTDFTFGFQTAVNIATDALDKLVTTAASHQRVMILEVMGRDAGWIALNAGIAGAADIILIPEIPFHVEKIVHYLHQHLERIKNYAIIVVAEGAKPAHGDSISHYSQNPSSEHKRLGGIGDWLMMQLENKISHDIRVSVLGHLQRGGSPTAFDRIIASEFGIKAVELIQSKRFGLMTSYQYPQVNAVPLAEAIKANKKVDTEAYLMTCAKGLGIYFGEK